MLLQYTKLDNTLGFVDLTLWTIGVIITYLIALFTLIKFKTKKDEFEKYQQENILTWGLFLLFIALANTVNIIWRFTISDIGVAESLELISQVFVYISFFIKVFNIERGINRSNFYKGYYFSILELISVIYGIIIYPFIKEIGIPQTINIILSIVGFAVFPLIFLYLGLKSTGVARTRSFMVAAGAIIMGTGMLLQPQNVEAYLLVLPNPEFLLAFFTIYCPVSILTGTILIFLSYRKSM